MEYIQTEFMQIESQGSQFDVIIRFEQPAEELFREMIYKIAIATGNATWLSSGQPPHVSMGIFDIVDESDPITVMEGVMRSLQSIYMTFDVIGAFMPRTLIVNPVVTDEIIAMSKAIHMVADQVFVPARQYVYGAWVPHLTLATELTHEELAQAFYTAGLGWSPVSARAVSVSLVHHFPYTEDLVVPLM